MIYGRHPLQAQQFALTVVEDTTPDEEPITLDMARWHLNIIPYGEPLASDDDDWLTTIGIPGARDWCEQFTARAIGKKTLEVSSDAFPSGFAQGYWFETGRYWLNYGADLSFALPMSPVTSVVSVGYTATDGTAAVISDAVLDYRAQPARLHSAFGTPWPTAQKQSNSVVIRYTAGYRLPADDPSVGPSLPPSIMSAMLFILGHLYENRENTTIGRAANIQEVPLGAEAFLVPYQLRNGFA